MVGVAVGDDYGGGSGYVAVVAAVLVFVSGGGDGVVDVAHVVVCVGCRSRYDGCQSATSLLVCRTA